MGIVVVMCRAGLTDVAGESAEAKADLAERSLEGVDACGGASANRDGAVGRACTGTPGVAGTVGIAVWVGVVAAAVVGAGEVGTGGRGRSGGAAEEERGGGGEGVVLH